jgi:transaldolase/glucose-6-phosphate isomerase
MLREDLKVSLGDYQNLVDEALSEINDNSIIERVCSRDHTVWKPEADDIENRLGWLKVAREMLDTVKNLEKLAEEVAEDGYTHALLLGMGGSSLAPEVLRKTFGFRKGSLDLAVLDSTDPDAVRNHSERLDPAKTLFIVSTKSGTTVETLSFFKYFYNQVVEAVGKEEAGRHFIAITDPGSMLVGLANRYAFRTTYLNDPSIGGRYSALSYFGMVPAVLIGLDLRFLLNRAIDTAESFMKTDVSRGGKDTAVILGTLMGALAKAGRNKLTLIVSPQIESFRYWVEQLIAESTGKEGRGILPVIGEPLGDSENYGDDRLFVCLCLKWDRYCDNEKIMLLENAGHPVVYLYMENIYDLGGQFFLWELAVAIAGYFLRINPFNQPDVEASKISAKRMLEEYKKKGKIPSEEPRLASQGMRIYGNVEGGTIEEAFTAFLNQSAPGDYVAFHAYVEQKSEIDEALSRLGTSIRDRYRIATTFGYGPRFLHSTGQLHKGDAGKGLFVQLTAENVNDIPIPDEAGSATSSTTFAVLKATQAMGDREALLGKGRRVIRLHFEEDIIKGLGFLADTVG